MTATQEPLPVEQCEPCPNPWCDFSDPVCERLRPFAKYRVDCGCGMTGPTAPSEAEAIAAWNTRSAPEASEAVAWQRLVPGLDVWADVSPADLEHYRKKGPVRPLYASPQPAEPTPEQPEQDRAVVETWESINQWCDDTFGFASIPQIIVRAKEEFVELEADGADHAIEAADVAICLCRIPGFAEALQRKMAINRKRKWRLTGDGTGYHIPDATPPQNLAKDTNDG